MGPASLLEEVRGFLSGLSREWPEVFAPRRPTPVAPGPGGADRIPAPRPDAAVKARPDGGDLPELFRGRAERWAPLLGVDFGRVRVKDQRSLWGSCTPKGDLNFNWRLSLAPDEVLDYLVVHELAHRAQMNHSRRFWALVERVCPEHRAHRRWLRRNAAALQAARYSDSFARISAASSGLRPESQRSPG